MILGFGIIYLGDFGLIAASAMLVGLLTMAFGILSWVRISHVDSPHHAH
jgi:cytochrome c oxidase subunit 1